MDAKITKKRLSLMLSYDWVKIVLSIVGLIIIWALIFSATSTKITASQQFTVYSYRGNNVLTNGNFYNSLDHAFKTEKIFSYEVIETDTYDFTTVDKEAHSLLNARLEVAQGDVIFLSPENDPYTAYTDEASGEVKYSRTYAQTFLKSYYYSLFNFDESDENSIFVQMEDFLNFFYDGDWENGTLNEAEVESYFRSYVKTEKDKRFKTEKQIKSGVLEEVERIKKYKAALIEMYGYLEKGYVQREETTIYDSFDETISITHAYSLNICPDENVAGNLINTISYQTKYVDEAGQTQTQNTAKNMQVAIFNFDQVKRGFEFESLLYINHLVRNALTVS